MPRLMLPSAFALACVLAACGSKGTPASSPSDGGTPDSSSFSSGGSSSSSSGSSGGSSSSGSGSGSDGGSSFDAGDSGPSPGGYPGQPGNPVGFAAAPGYPGTLEPWTGGDTVATSGTAGNPTVYSFYDFVPGQAQGGTFITGSHLKFVGCRFQSNDVENYNVQVTGSDVTFEYCSVTPLVSLAAAPPHEAWPSAGAGQQLTGNGTGYQIDGNSGYEYGFALNSGGPVSIDHCDIWGFGNAVTFMDTTAQMTVSSSWIHDAADAAAQKYHTDGPGYLNGGVPPQNVSIQGNTIASIGNTNGIAFQAATSAYQNIVVSGNYLSGFGYTSDMGLPGSTSGDTNMQFTNNVFGTDLPWVYGPIYADQTALFGQATNKWSGNTLKVLAGTSPVSGSWQWTSAQDGQFVWPDASTHTSDFQ
jgi:hypothetical protein